MVPENSICVVFAALCTRVPFCPPHVMAKISMCKQLGDTKGSRIEINISQRRCLGQKGSGRVWTHVDARTGAGPAADVARLAGLMHSVIVVSSRTGRKASAFLPQVEESWSAAQAAVLPTSDTFVAARVTSFTHPRVRVSVVAVGKMGRGVTDYIKGPILCKIHQSFLTIISVSSL